MNRFNCTCLFIVSLLFAYSTLQAQKYPGMDVSPSDISYYRGKDQTPLIKVIYGRPQKKGRVIFGDLEPYGKVWRTGANEATEIKFYKDAEIGGKQVKAGTYSLFTIPEKDKWTIILNSELDTWGAYDYNINKDVLRTEVKPQTLSNEVEAFSLFFKESPAGADLVLAWDKTQVEVPIHISK